MIQNKRDVEKLEKELIQIQKVLKRLSEDTFDEEIKKSWEELKRNAGQENLKKIPMDAISTLEKGMPINTLVNNGFHTIYDIKDEMPSELEQINGIGSITAELIYDAISKIKKSVFQQARPKINPDNLSKEEISMLASIYKKWQISDTVKLLKVDFKQLCEVIIPAIKAAKKQRNFIATLFQPKSEKEEIKKALELLNQEKHKKSRHHIILELNKLIRFSVNNDEVLQHFIQENASYYAEIEKITGFELNDMSEHLPDGIIEATNNFPLDTTGLNVQLRQYQTFGAKYALQHKRTLLGDEMGLGKTIQALAMINHLTQNNQKFSMVVCPLSVIANWKREIDQRSTLKTFIFHGNNRDAEFSKWQAHGGVLITTYEQTLRMNFDDEHLLDVLVVDEAHYIKNPDAQRSQSVYKLAERSEYVLFMSGTPLENRLEEMKQLLSILQDDIAEQLSQELHLLQPKEFRQLVAPVYLRRNRKNVLTELPELEIIPQWMDFGETEKEYYHQAVMSGKLMSMRRAAWQGGSPGESPKLERLLDICEKAQENGHKVLVFSFFKGVINTIQHHLKEKTSEAITGDVPNIRRQEIIDEFTKGKPGSVLISQINAGGVGLNIQAASIIILCEPQWKPSTEEQAISRAYRMGQARNVVVYRLLTEESIDVAMLDILGEKSNLFNLYARESEIAALALNEQNEADESVKEKVLQLEKERLNEKVS